MDAARATSGEAAARTVKLHLEAAQVRNPLEGPDIDAAEGAPVDFDERAVLGQLYIGRASMSEGGLPLTTQRIGKGLDVTHGLRTARTRGMKLVAFGSK